MNTFKTNIAYIPNTGLLIFEDVISGHIDEIKDSKINDENIFSQVAKYLQIRNQYEFEIVIKTFQDYDAANEWIRSDA